MSRTTWRETPLGEKLRPGALLSLLIYYARKQCHFEVISTAIDNQMNPGLRSIENKRAIWVVGQ